MVRKALIITEAFCDARGCHDALVVTSEKGSVGINNSNDPHTWVSMSYLDLRRILELCRERVREDYELERETPNE